MAPILMGTAKLEFAGGLGPGLLVLLFFVCAGLVILFYHRLYTYLGPAVVWVLIGFRVLGIAILLLLIFRPVMSFEEKVSHRMRLYLLLDSSRSMSISDFPNAPNRLADAVARVQNHMDTIQESFRASLYTFDTALREQKDDKWPEPEGAATNIIRAVRDIAAVAPRADTAGIVLMTDGIHNAGGNVLRDIQALAPPPIYTVGMGSALSGEGGFQDINIERVDASEEAIVNNLTQVKVSVGNAGLSGRAIRVELREKEQALDSQGLVLGDGKTLQTVTLTFTPTVEGRHSYEVFIAKDPDERIVENNSHTVNMLVTSPNIRVFYMEGVLRSEFTYLNRVLQTDPNVEVLSLVQIRQGGKFTQLGSLRDARVTGFPRTAEDMDKFDVFILGSLDRTYLSANQMKLLKEAIRDGKGFLMLGGQTSFGPGGYEGTPVEEILPVQVGPRGIGQETAPFVMRLTPEGAGHPIFSGIQPFFPRAKHMPFGAGRQAKDTPKNRLPLLTGCVVLGRAKPGASILAVHPERRNQQGNLIVLAVQQFGGGRTVAFAGDTTWRWYVPFRALGRDSPYVRFWSQMVRWLAAKEVKERATEPGVDLILRKPFYNLGEKVVITAKVREKEGRATNFADISAVVIAPDNKRMPLTMPNVPGAVGVYEAEMEPADPGDYRVVVEARKEGERLGLAEGNFTIGRPDQEFERLSTDEKLLREIARSTGGQFHRPASFGDLIGSLRSRDFEESLHREVSLYNLPIMFFVFLVLVTGEWLIRKYYQLN